MKRLAWKPHLWFLEIILWLMAASLAVLLAVEVEKNSPRRLRQSKPNFDGQKPTAKPLRFLQGRLPLSDDAWDSPTPGMNVRDNGNQYYGDFPLRFEENRGQAGKPVGFLARGSNEALFLTDQGALLQWRTPRIAKPAEGRPYRRPQVDDLAEGSGLPNNTARSLPTPLIGAWTQLGLRFEGSRSGFELRGEGRLEGTSNYLKGPDPRAWKVSIPNYSRVRCQGVYPGVDVVYYGRHQELEYDILIYPGTDPRVVQLAFEDPIGGRTALPLAISGDGGLRLQVNGLEIRQLKPEAYQIADGRKWPVNCEFVLRGTRRAGFHIGAYDPAMPLVIDPVISYTVTGVGGAAIAVDSQGNAYVVGEASPEFVTTPGAFQSTSGGGTCVSGPNAVPCSDILIAKINPTGTDLVYSTFLGGNGSDYGYGIQVDGAGNAYITGATSSSDFPTTPDSYQSLAPPCLNAPAGIPCYSAFVSKLNATGTALEYSTYLSGSPGGQAGNGIAIDAGGNAFLTGDGETEGFVTKLDKEGKSVIWTMDGIGGTAIALDASGAAYALGRSSSASTITKLSKDGASILYSYRLGGTFPQYSAPPQEIEALTGIAVDSQGCAYVTGFTAHKDFPTTPGALFPTAPGAGICGASICRDAVVTKLNPGGTALAYSTYLGGDSIDYGTGIAVDVSGNAFIAGYTRSSNFPVTPSSLTNQIGGAFLAKIDASGNRLVYSRRLGSGSAIEGSNGIAVDPFGNAYVTGHAGPGFGSTPGAYQPASGGNSSFVARVFDDLKLFVPVILATAGQGNAYFTSELTLTNHSKADVSVEFQYTAAFGGGSGKGSDTLAAGKQVVIPDAVTYLRLRGVPIPDSGNRGGTLAISFRGLSSAWEGAATVRTTTAVTRGRAGLAYSGIIGGLNEVAYLCGLRQNNSDRTNVAVQNAGTTLQGEIVLKLTVFSSDPGIPTSLNPPVYEVSLMPGDFKQFTGILHSAEPKISSGFVKIERVRGAAPYYAYAVINDQYSSDGSFVPPATGTLLMGQTSLALPVIVESSGFDSELVLTNWTETTKRLILEYGADGIQTPSSTARFSLVLKAHEQIILPNVVNWMRSFGVLGLPLGRTYVGPLFVSTTEGDLNGVFVGARTSSSGPDGRFGVFYTAVPGSQLSTSDAWLYDLQQGLNERSNVGLVNSGNLDLEADVFRIEIFDGETGLPASTVEGIIVNARRLVQLSSFLAKYAPQSRQGYIRITRTKGSNPFIAYSVINDGGQPGQGSGDGAFVYSSP